ncbi:MAG: glycosyltransferase, partial [Desulfonauticus sp.]|nr:glycosyltransferase [Desulfonauticus sp.]
MRETLSSFLDLNVEDLSWQILVADNADDLDTQEVLRSFQKRLPLKFIFVTRPGKNAALNELVKIAQGELFVFTDDDITPDPNWIIELWKAYKRWPNDILFGGKVIPNFPSNTPKWIKKSSFEYAPAAFAWFDKGEEERPFEDSPFGPNMAVRAKVFKDFGFEFDEHIGPCGYDYPMGSETSFCKKLKQINKRYIYVPTSVVYHRIRPDQVTFKALLERAYRHGRGLAVSHPEHNCKELFGAPRYLYKKIFILFLKYIMNYWRSPEEKWPYGK